MQNLISFHSRDDVHGRKISGCFFLGINDHKVIHGCTSQIAVKNMWIVPTGNYMDKSLLKVWNQHNYVRIMIRSSSTSVTILKSGC
jgi:hypothetical protein